MKTLPSSLVLLQVRVKRDTRDRVNRAAAAMDQSLSSWIRLAMIEKLERDGR